MNAVHLRLSGVVQGVGFRWFVRQEARGLGLAGWVRNCPDGTVEIAAAGEPDAVQRLERLVRRGPSGARVDRVETLPPVDPTELPLPFTVDR